MKPEEIEYVGDAIARVLNGADPNWSDVCGRAAILAHNRWLKRHAPKPPKTDSLVGLFGHTYDGENGARVWQFHIVMAVDKRFYGLQLFSWLGGWPTEIRVLSIEELLSKKPVFYQTQEEWLAAAEHRIAAVHGPKPK